VLSKHRTISRNGPKPVSPPEEALAPVSAAPLKGGLMTAIIYFGEILVVSIFAIVLLAFSPLEIGSAAAVFVGGAASWTLAEYAVHRFVLHGLARREHGLHHANPNDAVLTICWQIWICFALVYFIAGGAFLAGALVSYAWYLFVHHCAHHGQAYSASAARASMKPS
jgi:hypothetical protein